MASDLDGTLLHSNGTLSDRTIAAVAAGEAAGATFVLATGRPPRWIHDIGERLDNRGLAICANGAIVYNLANRQVVTSHTLLPGPGAEIVDRIRAAFASAIFAVETLDYLGLEPGWKLQWDAPEGTRFGAAEELVTVPAVKILARIEGHAVEQTLATLRRELTGLAEVTWSGGSHLLELSAPGVSKGVVLAELAASLGVNATDCVAFGDMPNDIDMLRWAGWGVAVANAHPLVIEAADAVASANNQDGVAAYLESLFG